MNAMHNILILGSGGREHALAWKIRQSRLVKKLYVAPGNAGTADVATNIPIDVTDFDELRRFCIEEQVDMLVVGPEVPLVEGVADFFRRDPMLTHLAVIGPSAKGANLEGSKAFAKDFMQRHGIPTARYLSVKEENLAEGHAFLEQLQPPYVLKADGLAAGKGVLILNDLETAKTELNAMLNGLFGKASAEVVIEEYLHGIELSAFVITDGSNFLMLPSAKDYKRIGEGDTGPNTGGMGAVSPVPFADKLFMDKVRSRIVQPTVEGLRKEQIDYQGFIFVGLMNVQGDPYVIEYNVRLGDPETEVILPRIKSDLVELFLACNRKTLNHFKLETDERYAVTVVLAAKGYPGEYAKGMPIRKLEQVNECVVFHAGTATDASTGLPKSSGGRVLAVTALNINLHDARSTALDNAGLIQFDGKYFRNDIGLDVIRFKM